MKRTIVIIFLVTCLLHLHLMTVSTGFLCPPIVNNVNFEMVLEVHNIPLKCVQFSNLTIVINSSIDAVSCEGKVCGFVEQVVNFNYYVKVLGKSSGLQYNFTLDNKSVRYIPFGNYTARWSCEDLNSSFSCVVKRGDEEDECLKYTPCMYGSTCEDHIVGYECKCLEGYSGINCSEADLQLYCNHTDVGFSSYGRVCSQPGAVKCYLAGDILATPLNLSIPKTSAEIDLKINATNETVTFQICFTSHSMAGNYIINGTVTSSGGEEFIITFNLTLGTIFLNVPEIGYYYYKVNETKAANETIASVLKSLTLKQCNDCILVLDSKDTENINLDATFEKGSMINYDVKSMRFFVANKLAGPQILHTELKAIVGASDFGSVNVTFEIIDDPVECVNLTLTFPAIDICVKNTNLTKINCSGHYLEKLIYSVEKSYSEYFMVTDDGVLQVIKPLISLAPGAHSFNISVHDQDTSIQVFIFLIVPGIECHWNFTSLLPSIWTLNSSFSLQVECDDLTSYNIIGSGDIFIITASLNNSILNLNFTLNNNVVGTYNFLVNLTNSAGNFTVLTVPIAVFNKPVVKNFNHAFVFENQEINDHITDIKASTNTPNAVLFFNITGGNQDNLFSIILSNGTVMIADALRLATKELYELKIQIKDNISQLETLTDLEIQILPVCNLTVWNPLWCHNLQNNSEVGKLKCLHMVSVLVLPDITIQDDGNFKALVSDNGYILNVFGSCPFNSSLRIMVSYRNYQTNFTWMVNTIEDCMCIQGNDAATSPLVFHVYVECEVHCITSTTSTVISNKTESYSTQNTREETTIQELSTLKITTEEPNIKRDIEISVFQNTTAEIYSLENFYFNGTISGNDRKLFKLITTEGKLQLFLTQDLTESDVGPYLLIITAMNSSNVTRKFIFNVTVKATLSCGNPLSLNRFQVGKDNITYILNCSVLFNDTNTKIEYKLIKIVPGEIQIQIVDNAIKFTQDLLIDCTNFTVVVSASHENETKYVKFDFIIKEFCSQDIGSDGVVFNMTPADQFYKADCPKDKLGDVLRYCQKNAQWGPYTLKNCSRKDLNETADLAKSLNSSSLNMSIVKEIFEKINVSLNKDPTLGTKDVQNLLFIMKDVGKIFSESQAAMEIATLETVVRIADQLVSANTSIWEEKKNEAAFVLDSMEMLASAATKSLTSAMNNKIIVKNNIAITLNAFSPGIDYDSMRQKGWMNETVNKVFLSFDDTEGSLNYSIILYKNLADSIKLNESLQEKYNEAKSLLYKRMNSKIISIALSKGSSFLNKSNVKITMSYLNNNYSEPVCVFLNTSVSEIGLWSTSGCTTESVSKDYITCSCNHLTNFAVLMSPVGTFEDNLALSIISIVGCSISLLCLVVTVVTYLVLWKYMKNDRSVLHMNLSVCLIIGYIVFLAGIERTSDKVSCTVVAVLLHYFFLTVFFIMLAEGIEIIKSVSFVFTSKSILRYLLAGAYGIPLLIVCISLAITQTDGYGNNKYCWLSIDDGLVWAFVGPVLLIFLANIIIVIIVIHTMQKSQIIKDKSLPDKVKSASRSICILSPILGLAWIFGVLSVNKESVVFQYLFAIFNSLQGLFIFIFQCLLQHQVKDGMKEKHRKYKAKSIDSGQRLVSTSSSVRDYSDSYKSKMTQSSGVNEKAYDFPLFPNAVYKNRRDSSKSSQEEVTSNSSTDDSRGCKSPIEQKNEKHYKKSYMGTNFRRFHSIDSHISDTDKSYGISFQNPGFLNNENDLNYDEGNTLTEKERLEYIYRDVKAVRHLSNNSQNIDNSQVQAKERWKKLQSLTKSGSVTKKPEKNAQEIFFTSQLSTTAESYKHTDKKKVLHQPPPLIIPRPTTVIGQSPGYHSNI